MLLAEFAAGRNVLKRNTYGSKSINRATVSSMAFLKVKHINEWNLYRSLLEVRLQLKPIGVMYSLLTIDV